MADEAYYRWVNAGKPYSLAYGCRDLEACLTGHGYTVWYYPDEAHQRADPAQDHTAYSETGWPNTSPEWWGHALDIPQPAAGKRSKINGLLLPPIEVLSAQILKDRKAEHPGITWLKYMNRPASAAIWQAPFYQERFMPDYERRNSTDWGHIHISSRSDRTRTSTEATRAYDPVARAQGVDGMTPAEIEATAQASGKEILDDRKWADYVPNANGDRILTTLPTAVFLARKDSYEGSNKTSAALTKLDELLARPAAPSAEVDQAQLDASVRSALSDPEVVAPIAAAVADEIWRRMQPGT
jgi:hypothetical protein